MTVKLVFNFKHIDKSRGVAAGRAGRAIALPIFWQETAVTVTS